MALNPVDSRPTGDQQQPADTTTTTTTEPPKKFPKGIVLGKDGKPCRSCTSFAAWASQTKKQTTTTTTPKPVTAPTPIPNDCPPDVETLGRSGWTLLHSIAATYPTQPTPAEQSDVRSFMRLFARLYPCWTCGEDFARYMAPGNRPVRAGSRDELGTWLCEAHNEVNRKLGKEVFDCGRWEERWRTGWRDGRCD